MSVRTHSPALLPRLALLLALVLPLAAGAAAADPMAECHRLAANPSDREHVGLGVEIGKLDPAPAIMACLQAVDANPKDGRLVYQLGRAYDAAKDFASAENAYLRAVDLGFDLAKRNLGFLYQDGDDVVQDSRKSERWFRAAIRDGDMVAANQLAWNRAVSGKELREALTLARRAVESDPADTDFRDTLAWVYFRLERFDDAVKEMEQVIAGEPESASFQSHLGRIYDALGRTGEARVALQRALDLPAPEPSYDPTFDRAAIEARLAAMDS